jgi:hypothetical protein
LDGFAKRENGKQKHDSKISKKSELFFSEIIALDVMSKREKQEAVNFLDTHTEKL